MFTLIKREIRDSLIYFIGAFVFSVIVVCISIPPLYSSRTHHPPLLDALGVVAVIVGAFAFFAMGTTQMYLDKNRKISAFLSTLSITRNQILLARVITSVLAILIFFVPLIITAAISIRFLHPYAYPYLFDISTAILLLVFACYCIGLLIGWTDGKIVPVLGGLILVFIFTSLVFVKGFGSDFAALLILFIIACLVRVRQKFISTSL